MFVMKFKLVKDFKPTGDQPQASGGVAPEGGREEIRRLGRGAV